MIASERTQSLSEFRKKAAETINRLNKTGEAEILTVNGEARAVLLAGSAVYDELAREALLTRDLTAIRRSRQQFKEGKSQEVNEFFGELRAELLAKKAREMKRLKVRASDDVKRQIREQVRYIARHSIDNALAWEDRLLAALNGLGELHSHAVDRQASKRLGGTIRKMVFEKTYLIHYEVNDAAKVVEVVNFRHGARLPRPGEP